MSKIQGGGEISKIWREKRRKLWESFILNIHEKNKTRKIENIKNEDN